MSQDSAALSLLSLSLAAESAPHLALEPSSAGSKHPSAPAHHRRLSSSTGRRRRLSDARDAATRPISVGSPISSMAAMSLSSVSPPTSSIPLPGSAPTKGSTPIPIASNGPGRKKRGVDHKCETCSKIYRHPSCLIKHRWEHTPHWRTLASLPTGGGGVLSKHAQVQLLEAAAILSNLSPVSDNGTSLPEDRGMWPRWCSGGVLEGEDTVSTSYGSPGYGSVPGVSESFNGYGFAARSAGAGPRLHDYEVPRGAQVRAGVVQVPNPRHGHSHSLGSSAWSVPRSVSVSASVSSEQSRSRSTPSDDEELEEDEGYLRGRGNARVWKHEEDDDDLGYDLRGVREERELEETLEQDNDKEKARETESLRWAGMQEDDIDMDLD
ncbi:C2H2-type domain-containing protein [Mycena indigotica]|uniref:C2H2-type domain-containing protein n=1 Tax=Mycena indigotica TaxID=2126181 RepID=A0A8H6W1D7_9AGAR|nr:C2H2-type domain-containing protein [Mycena indigotica]KAF7301964.1 C2H2-type domain-containing protein [Mycena indigotica]